MPFDDDDEKFGAEATHPAWKEGRIAFQKEIKLDDNPYGWGTEEYEAWNQGWHEALTGQEMG
jgi:hypothetical protein